MEPMKIKKLIKGLDLEVKGSKEVEIAGICEDSKIVCPKDLFIARRGRVFDGTHFIPEAISAGAVCILTDIYNPFYAKTTQLITKNIKEAAIEIAKSFYGNPQEKLLMVGITGTCGKTTVSYLVKHLLDKVGKEAGIIGTNGYQIKDAILAASRTTPDSITCLKILKEMESKKLSSCVMETSSHALDQNRVDFIDFDLAIFTNLSHEHLDYHGNMEAYLLAKKKLFSLLEKSKKPNKCALLNADDPASCLLQKNYSGKMLTFSINEKADIMATDLNLSLSKSQIWISYKEEKELFTTSLIGTFNVYNLLAAVSVGVHLGYHLKELSKIFQSFSFVEGRMQKVLEYKKCHVFIDYAHKPQALKNVLEMLKQTAKGKIITLFGCGGNRDREKRREMAKIAEKYSDFSIVTNDNPRTEDPDKIIQEIEQGFSNKAYAIVQDRREAIRKALQLAEKEDIVLVAGKGHEKVQIYSHKSIPFDDREVVLELVEE